MEEEYLTKKGFEQLKKDLEELRDVKKWEIAQWLREAATQGDLDENADYLAAKEAQTALETKIEEMESKIRNAKIITRRQKDVAGIGSKVHVATTGNKKMQVHLVSSSETNGEGKVSASSPFGKALLGKKVGDNIEVITPKGKKRYKITKLI